MKAIFWKSKASLRKGLFRTAPNEDIQLTGNTLQGGGGGPPAIDYLLNATFHRYGPAGPLVLLDGDIMSDTGTDEAEIDKGDLRLVIGSSTGTTLENEQLRQDVGGGIQSGFVSDGVIITPVEAGLTCKSVQFLQGSWVYGFAGFNASLTPEADRRRYVGILRQNDLACQWNQDEGAIELPHHTALISGVTSETSVVMGGYNALLEPDPAGNNGALYFVGSLLIYSWAIAAETKAVPIISNTSIEPNRLDSIQVYIDPAPLATPHRSIFTAAADQALSAYTPENGGAFTGGDLADFTIASGALVPTVAWAEKYTYYDLPAPAKFHETSYSSVSDVHRWGSAIRATSGGNYWRVAYGASRAQIYETTDGTPVLRSEISIGANNSGRVIAEDDGTLVACIVLGNGGTGVTSHSSVASAAEVGCGVYIYQSGGGYNWECNRT